MTRAHRGNRGAKVPICHRGGGEGVPRDPPPAGEGGKKFKGFPLTHRMSK